MLLPGEQSGLENKNISLINFLKAVMLDIGF